MNLNKITVDIRSRSQWEAMDLGMTLIRNYWRPIYISWIMATLPLVIILCYFFQGHTWVPILILWYAKPLFDRLPLYFLSRMFFGEIPNFKKSIKKLPGFILKNLFLDLTIFRFSPWRSFLMPVRQLEGLKIRKRIRIKRIQVLAKGNRGWATLLTILCLVFELGIFFSWYLFLYVIFMDFIITPADIFIQTDLWKFILQVCLYYISMSLVETCYVAGGFALYINRRVFLEGWDIELIFRQMAARLNPSKEEKYSI
jgi:hypothetical protein